MPQPIPAREIESESFGLLAAQRRRVRDFLALQQERLQRVETELAQQLQQVADELAHDRQQASAVQEELGQRETQVAEQTESLQRLRKELDARLAQWDRLQQTAGQRHEAIDEQIRRHEEQLQSLHDVCAELNQQSIDRLLQAPPPDGDLQRLYDTASADLREMKGRNAQLKRQLAQGPAPGDDGGGPADARMNWEAQKERILADLESDNTEDGVTLIERQKIEDVVRATDEALAEKDRQIGELRQLALERADEAHLSPAAGEEGDVSGRLETDPVICEEREHLARLRVQWEEKLRQAEIELSIERAKLARDRAEIEEKLRAMESRGDKAESAADAAAHGKPARGRWLARLGLKDSDVK